jgi:hypothetical protein
MWNVCLREPYLKCPNHSSMFVRFPIGASEKAESNRAVIGSPDARSCEPAPRDPKRREVEMKLIMTLAAFATISAFLSLISMSG